MKLTGAIPSVPRPPDLRVLATEFAQRGAVMTFGSSSCVSYLVGALHWSEDEPQRLVFFAANGDRAEDAHGFSFDRAEGAEHRLDFIRDGKRVGSLAPIDHAPVDDRDDFRIGWEIWQQVAPLRSSFVEQTLSKLGEAD